MDLSTEAIHVHATRLEECATHMLAGETILTPETLTAAARVLRGLARDRDVLWRGIDTRDLEMAAVDSIRVMLIAETDVPVAAFVDDHVRNVVIMWKDAMRRLNHLIVAAEACVKDDGGRGKEELARALEFIRKEPPVSRF